MAAKAKARARAAGARPKRGAAASGAAALRAAKRIRLLIFDVDGVLTDGSIWYFPLRPDAPNRAEAAAEDAAQLGDGERPMVEVKAFSAHDGIGLMLAKRAGLRTGVITKRVSQSLAWRARDLKMDFVLQGVERKGEALARLLGEQNLKPEEVCCMGDDIIDLPMLRACGLPAAPANARREVLAAAAFVAPSAGGAGAARDVVEFILRAQGRWEAVAAQYLASDAG